MAKITLDNLATLANEQSAIQKINSNNDRIEVAFTNTLSRDGASPNEMNVVLDMNDNRIINLGQPLADDDAVRLKDVYDILDTFQNDEDEDGSDPLVFNINADVALAFIDPTVTHILVLGYAKKYDGGGARYKLKPSPTVAPTNNLAWVRSLNGLYFVNDESRLDVRTFGIFADGQKLSGGFITAASTTLTVPGAAFTSDDVGKWIQIDGAGELREFFAGNWIDDLTTKIKSILGTTQVELEIAASQTVLTTDPVLKYTYWATDYTTKLQNCCRAAATMKKPFFFPGSKFFYLTNQSICGLNGYNDIHCYGEGPQSWIMQGNYNSEPLLAYENYHFFIVGALVARTEISSLTLSNQDTIPVLSTTSLVAGDWLSLRDKSQKIYSQDKEDPFGLFNGYQGEPIRIRKVIDSTHLQLHNTLENDYFASTVDLEESDVREFIPITDINIHDLCFDVSKTLQQYSGGGIGLSRTYRTNIKNCFFAHQQHGALSINYPIDMVIDNCRFEWVGGLDGTTPDGDHDPAKGYGMVITGGAVNTRISNCIGRNVRHFVTASNANDIAPRHILMNNCLVTECRVAFDTHPGADYWTLSNCIAVGTIYAEEVLQYGYGFQIRGNHNEIINCSARNIGIGIQTVFIKGTRLINFSAFNCEVGISVFNCKDTLILNTKIYHPKTMGLFYHEALTGNTIQSIGDLYIDGFWIYGNPDRNQTLAEDYPCELPCGMQFGYWVLGSPGTFTAQWRDTIIIKNWHMDLVDVPFNGADHEAVYGPGIQNAIQAESISRNLVNVTPLTLLTSGQMYVQEIDLEKGRKITGLGTVFGSAGTTQTNLWFALLDKDRNLLSKTSNMTTTEPTPDILTSLTLDRPHRVWYTGRHYIGIVCTGAVMPTVYGTTIQDVFAGFVPIRSGTSNTGLTTPAAYPSIASATSTTSLKITKLYNKIITTQAGKAFVKGMRVWIISNDDPTQYMLGRVTSYATTILKVDVDTISGSDTFDDWTITAFATATVITPNGLTPYVVAI